MLAPLTLQTPAAQATVGSAKFKREPGVSKFARLKILKTSVLNSRFVLSENLKRFMKTRSNCWKFGPRRKFRGTLPNFPGAGVVNAAGFRMSRSLVRKGLTPGSKSGRRTLRDAPPPGVFTTAIKPAGGLPDSCATKPVGNPPQPAAFTHWITTSG